jgi:hypothetical protein
VPGAIRSAGDDNTTSASYTILDAPASIVTRSQRLSNMSTYPWCSAPVSQRSVRTSWPLPEGATWSTAETACGVSKPKVHPTVRFSGLESSIVYTLALGDEPD